MDTRFLASLFIACALPAQIFVVDPLGGGTHTDLQAAINAAPAGAIIQVLGGTYGPLVITRSVTVLGVNTPHLRSPPFSGSGQQPPAIRLQGTGSETAVFAGLDIGGQCGGLWNFAGPGVASTGFARVAIYDSAVRGHVWTQANGVAWGASAIVADGTTLHVARCVVAASASESGVFDVWAPSGAAAIAAPSASLVLLHSTVNGGDAGSTRFFFQPSTVPCPCGTAGLGGTGVVAANVFTSGSIVTGGSGSPVLFGVPGPTLPTPWGQQPGGVPFAASTVVTTLPATLAQTAPLRLGAVYSIGFVPSNALSLLLIGNPAPWPVAAAGVQFVAVDLAQPIAIEFVPATATSWSLPVPPMPGLLGFELAEQRFDLAASGTWLATNPLFGVVGP